MTNEGSNLVLTTNTRTRVTSDIDIQWIFLMVWTQHLDNERMLREGCILYLMGVQGVTVPQTQPPWDNV